MKVPEKVAANPVLEAERRGGLKERELALGGAVASDIERDWNRPLGRGLVHFEQAPEETTLAFSFKHPQGTLAGHCTEHLKSNLMGLKNPKVSLACTCKDGDRSLGEVALEQSQGSAELAGGGAYRVYGIYTASNGRKRDEVLGYWFLSQAGEGAVELKGEGRAWLPPNVSPEQRPALLCLYAAMLLYRPGEAK